MTRSIFAARCRIEVRSGFVIDRVVEQMIEEIEKHACERRNWSHEEYVEEIKAREDKEDEYSVSS